MKKIIDYALEALNRENGGSTFERLAASLAEAEICSNILPSTGPSGGGDKGIDARTYKTYLDNSEFRLWQSSEKSPTNKRIIFAFSINKKWKGKVKSDIKIIIDNKLDPDEIKFITNQFIKTKTREEAINELNKEFKINLEIFDGEWISNNLSQKHYRLAVEYFDLPPEQNPKMVELYERIYSFRNKGITDAESVKVNELMERASYKASYLIPEQRIIDLKQAADIQAEYSQTVNQSIICYEEALTDINSSIDKLLISDLFYCYFKALQRVRSFSKITKELPKYKNYVLVNKVTSHYPKIFTWVFYLFPHKAEIGSFDLLTFTNECLGALLLIDKNKLSTHYQAVLDEAISWGQTYLALINNKEQKIIQIWKEHIEKYYQEPLYSISFYSGLLANLAPIFESDPSFEELYVTVEKILLDKNSVKEAAQIRKDRAVSLYKFKRYEDCVHHLNVVKIKWFDIETIRGSILSSLITAKCYSELKLHYAAIYELFAAIQVANSNEEIFSDNKDLFFEALTMLYGEYILIGLYGSSFIIGKLALLFDYKFGIDTEKNFINIFDNNSALLLKRIRNYKNFHKQLLKMLDDIELPYLESYKSISIIDDKEFEKYISDINPESQAVARELREALRKDLIPTKIDEGQASPVNENDEKQNRSFLYKDIVFNIHFRNSYENKLIAEYLLSFLQIMIIELLNHKDITWIENSININIIEEELDQDFLVIEKPNNDMVDLELKINPPSNSGFYQSPFSIIKDIESVFLSNLLLECTIDKSDYIKELLETLDQSGFFESLFTRIPYGLPFSQYFNKEEYKLLINKDE